MHDLLGPLEGAPRREHVSKDKLGRFSGRAGEGEDGGGEGKVKGRRGTGRRGEGHEDRRGVGGEG